MQMCENKLISQYYFKNNYASVNYLVFLHINLKDTEFEFLKVELLQRDE